MKAGKVKKQSNRNSRINLSHTLESNKTKATKQHNSLINILHQNTTYFVLYDNILHRNPDK